MSESIYRVLGKKGRVTIPFEIRQKVGFKYNDVLSFKQVNENAVVVTREKICDNCNVKAKTLTDDISLLDVLDNLSKDEQRAALIHLSLKWASEKEKSIYVN